jgi:hypothetical protein
MFSFCPKVRFLVQSKCYFTGFAGEKHGDETAFSELLPWLESVTRCLDPWKAKARFSFFTELLLLLLTYGFSFNISMIPRCVTSMFVRERRL